MPGQIGAQLAEMGYKLDIRAPIFGEPLPDELDEFSGALVFGGPMSVNDDEPYLKKEAAWVEQVLAAGLPYLGICLGGQLLARVLGASVTCHYEGLEEIGYYPIYATETGTAVFPAQLMVYQWHKEGFELPTGAISLAYGETFPNQAFRWGDRAYALQFHPEMTDDMLHFWTTEGAELMGAPNTQPSEVQFDHHYYHRAAVRDWLETFLNNWLAN